MKSLQKLLLITLITTQFTTAASTTDWVNAMNDHASSSVIGCATYIGAAALTSAITNHYLLPIGNKGPRKLDLQISIITGLVGGISCATIPLVYTCTKLFTGKGQLWPTFLPTVFTFLAGITPSKRKDFATTDWSEVDIPWEDRLQSGFKAALSLGALPTVAALCATYLVCGYKK